MEYVKFSEIISLLKSQSDKVNAAYNLKIYLIDFNAELNRVIDILIKEVYGDEGYEWFTWFCYENDFGEKDWSGLPLYKKINDEIVKVEEVKKDRFGAHDEEGNPICYSVESTWEYLEKYHNRIPKDPWKKIENSFKKKKK